MKENETLPTWAVRFLNLVCPDYLVEEIEGDIVQKYKFDVDQYGLKSVKRKLIWNIFRFLRPGIFMRNRFSMELNQLIMVRNYLITALRVSRRQRLYTFINILGLSVGLAASLLIAVYIADELSYDYHIKDVERIYRVGINETFKGDEILYSHSSAPLAEALRTELPDVEDATRVLKVDVPVRFDDKAFMEKTFLYADSNFFEFFGYKLIEGNAKECLKGPEKVVLSASAAKKYFNYDGKGPSPVGKQLIVGRSAKLTEVTGIFEDIPTNTHMKFDMLGSLESIGFSKSECWGCYGVFTYFKTVQSSTVGVVEAKLEEFAQKRIIPSIEKDLNISHEQFVKSGDRVSFFTQPFLSIHLQSKLDEEFEPNGDIRYIYIFGITGIFLVLLACVNFMNLSTARAINRGKEVGVRKTMGATRSGLVPQFMLESFLYVFVSGILAIVITYLALEPFSTLSGKNLQLDLFSNVYIIPAIVLFLLVVGFLAGSYPAFHLTSFNPVTVLKAGKMNNSSRSLVRSSLVVFQFTISMVLIIGTLIIYKQLEFIQNQNLGFEKENVIRVPQTYLLGNNYLSFKDEVVKLSGVVDASYTQALPPDISSTTFIKAEHSEQLVGTFYFAADHDLVRTMGYEMKSGRYFLHQFPSDSDAVVINEACARLMGYDIAEGQRLGFADNDMYNVIGVVKDFNFASLKSEVEPLCIFLSGDVRRTMAVRVAPGDPTEKLKQVHSIWKKYADGQPFEYSFIDDDFDALFRAEQRLGVVVAIFTGMAILIACLGLFGLITFIAAQRTKEIGIRKVMGASSGQLTVLLLKDLVRLVIISFVIAIPFAWYGSEQWLQSFAYRTTFDAYSVIVAGASGILITILTVGYRSLRAASANPAESLKNE